MIKRFQSHAQSPEHVADTILDGIERDRYMVYTSRDIQLGFWVQRKFALPYELAIGSPTTASRARRSRGGRSSRDGL